LSPREAGKPADQWLNASINGVGGPARGRIKLPMTKQFMFGLAAESPAGAAVLCDRAASAAAAGLAWLQGLALTRHRIRIGEMLAGDVARLLST